MLSVAVHKDIGEYQPKLVGKLTTRTLICIVGAVGMSVIAGLYMTFVLGIKVQDNVIIIYGISLPFWLAGFWRPKGMKFEEFLPVFIRHKYSENRVDYNPTSALLGYKADLGKHSYGKEQKKFMAMAGVEAYSPRLGRVLKGDEDLDNMQ